MLKMNRKCLGAMAASVVAIAVSGCSTSQGNFPAPSTPAATASTAKAGGPPPKVEDCEIVNVGSPNKYVCNGKVYTTFQLTKQRLAYEAQQNSGQ